MIKALAVIAASVVSTAAPTSAGKVVGFMLIDVEGRDADYLAKVGIRGTGPMLQAIVNRHPESVVAAQTLDITDTEQEARFATLPPAVVPKAGVPASAYILKYRLGVPGIAGSLRYMDFTRKPSPTQSEPTGPGIAIDAKALAVHLSKKPIMYVYGALTRARNHGSRFLIAVFQPDTVVKAEELATISAFQGNGIP